MNTKRCRVTGGLWFNFPWLDFAVRFPGRWRPEFGARYPGRIYWRGHYRAEWGYWWWMPMRIPMRIPVRTTP